MTRKLIFANLLLLGLVYLLGWQLRREWRRETDKEQALYRYRMTPVPTPALPPVPKQAPLEAATYAAVAQNNLFSSDRNPNVILDPEKPPPPKPQPPFPVARGVMLWDGTPPTVVLAEKAGGAQKGYHPGDAVGDWKIVSIDNQYVVLAWDGKEFQKRIDEMLDRTPLEMPGPAAPAATAKPAPSPSTTLSDSNKAGPGVDMGGARACIPGDTSPAGTVASGFKKVVTASPFGGATCRWEPTQ